MPSMHRVKNRQHASTAVRPHATLTRALDYGKGNGGGEIVDAAFAAAAVALLGLLLSEPVSLVLTCQTSAVMRVSRQIYIVGIK